MPVPLQVAAVCYRRRRSGVEFLLIRSSGGRWIFPKGGTDSALSNCEAAAREAWEEAGALGIIEPRAFSVFRHAREEELVLVEAYLLEVLRTAFPEEAHRSPTWFSTENVKHAIREGRDMQSSAELSRVVDAALKAIAAGEGVA